jgi:hypothetical protein
MPIEPIDAFDPLDPNSCSDWDAKAERYLEARIRETREKQPRVSRANDLNVMFVDGGDSGQCVDGKLEWESERKELIEKILAARKQEIGTGL